MKDKVLIEEVHNQAPDLTPPILLKFQNGKLGTSDKRNVSYFPAKSQDENSKRAFVIASGHVYSGTIGEGLTSQLTDTYICVRNRTTNKVRIIPIDQANLINHIYKENEEKRIEKNIQSMSKETSFNLMVKNFGGRKDQRFHSNKERSKVNIDGVKDQLEIALDESSLLEVSNPIISLEENIDKIRPPFDKNAERLDDIFQINDIIPNELLTRLEDEVNAIVLADNNDIPIRSEFLLKALENLKNQPQSHENRLKIKFIVYMDALQNLVQCKSRNLQKATLSDITEKVENDVKSRFAEGFGGGGWRRTVLASEKGLCYFLVLAFFVSENYRLDLNELSKDLCLSKSMITKYAQLVNGAVSGSMLHLKLPSQMKPISSNYRRRKKGI